MKKIFLSVMLSTMVAFGAFAQLSGGIKLGINSSNTKFEADGFSASPDSKIGIVGGVYVNASLGESLFVQPELLYSGMGSKSGDINTNLSYVQVPIMVGYKIVDAFNLHLGPQLGFLMSAKADDEDIKDGLKSIDFGLAFGAGANFGKLNVALRYYAGLSNIADTDDDSFSIKNNAIQLTLGYQLFGE